MEILFAQKRFHINTIKVCENVLQQDFSTSKLNQKWVADITYIHTLRDGWYNRRRIHGQLNFQMPQEVED